jgi:thiol-disulfide isomerase/thioredoxin
MTRRIFALLGGLAWALGLPAAEIKLPTLTVGSTIYSNVTVTSVTATDIYFKHSTGMSNTKLRYLEPALQQKFNYQPEVAADIERKQTPAAAGSAPAGYLPPWVRPPPSTVAAVADATTSVAPQGNPFADPIADGSFINKPVPDLNVEKWYSDKPGSTAGKCVIILFWTSQSEACRRVIPDLNALQKKFSDNLVVIGVTSESEREVSQMTDLPIEFYYGSDGKSVTRTTVGVTSLPCALLVDPKGIIRYQGHPAALKEDAIDRYFVH